MAINFKGAHFPKEVILTLFGNVWIAGCLWPCASADTRYGDSLPWNKREGKETLTELNYF